MLSSSVLVFSSFCSIAWGAKLVDVTSNPKLRTLELSSNSTCSFKDLFVTPSTFYDHLDVIPHHPSNKDKSLNQSPLHPRSTDPWTVRPTCSASNDTSFCVYTASNFSLNRGISFLTKPSIGASISKLPAFSSSRGSSLDQGHDSRPPPFIVTSIPGRGMGLIANRTIERGDLIKVHSAIAIFHNDAVDKSTPEYQHTKSLMKKAVDQLPSFTQKLFMDMAAHNESEEPIVERIYTNTFGEDFGGEEHSVVVPETARLNHDCRPNSMYYFDRQTLKHYTHAARTISAGEEITITYVDPLQTRLRRRAALKRSWGFECSCSLCLQESQFTRESNRRIMQIKKLTNAFGETDTAKNKSGKRRINGTPQMAELLISLYEQERLHASIADGYRLAAVAYSAVGNEWMAVKWAMKAVEAGLIHDGPRERNVFEMERFLDEPRKHWTWGVNFNEHEKLRDEIEQ